MEQLIKTFHGDNKWCVTGTPFNKTNDCLIEMVNFSLDYKNNLKHNLYTPGSKIKIINPLAKAIRKTNSLIILSWNFYDEIYKFLKKIEYRGTIIKPLPLIKVVRL